MKTLAKPLRLVLLVCLIAGLTAGESRGDSGGLEIKSVPGLLKPVRHPDPPFKVVIEKIIAAGNGGQTEIQWAIESDVPLREIEMFVFASKGMTVDVPERWFLPLNGEKRFSRTLMADIPLDTMSQLTFWAWGKDPLGLARLTRHFSTTGDTLEVYERVAGPYQVQPPKTDPNRDSLTPEQLATVYEMVVDLRDSTHLEFARKLLDSLPLPITPGLYRVWITLDNILKLHEKGIDFQDRERIPDNPEKNTSDQQGALDPPRSPSSLPGISLDTTFGLIDATTLQMDADSVVFRLRLNNN